jgi:hypothetical protein
MRAVIIIIFSFFILTACVSEPKLQGWEKKIHENPITIAVVGEKPDIDVSGVTLVPLQSTDGEYKAIWVREEELENFYTKEGISEIKQLLDNNNVIFFLGEGNAHKTIAPLLGIKGYEESTGGNVVQVAFYFWKENEKIRLGFLGVTEDASPEKEWNLILEQTVNHSKLN